MAAPRVGDTLAGSPLRATSRSSPVRCSARRGPVSARSRRGYGNTAKIAARAARSGNGRCRPPPTGTPPAGAPPAAPAPLASRTPPGPASPVSGASSGPSAPATSCRWASGCTGGACSGSSVQAQAASISRSYWTPDGQAVMQAIQPRQRSKCSAAAVLSSSPSSTWVTRWIRPRGESISSPHSEYVGQAGRQNPQCTQSPARSRSSLSSTQIPPGPRPGDIRSRGSNCCLTARISPSDGTGPHRST